MEMKTRVMGDVHVIEIEGRFDTHTAPPIAAWLEQVSAIPAVHILVNLSNTTFIDSTGLATLVQALRRCQQLRGDLALCSMPRPIRMIFELTRLDLAFTLYVDEHHALQSFAL